ncbi:hypothetical protein BTVI_64520 [Pitangus sulphuratus]|nr:hypothetical protein BTVI_64520 [Pitangus sulphuratus]
MRIRERNNHEDTKHNEERGGRAAQDNRVDSPAVCGEDHGDASYSLAADAEQVSILQPMKDAEGGKYAPKEAGVHGEKPIHKQVFWKVLCPVGDRQLEPSVPEGLQPMKRIHAVAVLEELQRRSDIGDVP